MVAFVVVAAVGCATEDVPVSETVSSPLTLRIGNDSTAINVARTGVATSSGAYSTQPEWTINDGRRGSPYDSTLSQYAYWASNTTSTLYNCNYGNWWVSVRFTQSRPGEVCSANGCVRNISEIDLFSLQNNYTSGTDPTASTTTSAYGNVDFHLQYCPEGVTCYPNGSGWVQPSGGYIIANNKAWTSLSFAPVRATAVRASFDCAQSTRAYAVELEAWEQQATACPIVTIPPPADVNLYINDDTSTAAIIDDSDRFWRTYFGCSHYYCDDVATINEAFLNNYTIGVRWDWAARASALVQMYDLLAPIDFPRAMVYLERLRQMSHVFLAYRDDKRTGFPNLGPLYPYAQPPYDPFHERVMPAWGSVGGLGEGQWNGTWISQVDMSALLTYPMAAFARRVAEHPEWFCAQYTQDAITFTTAVIDTYIAFSPDMRFSDPSNPAYAYYMALDRQHPNAWNVTLSSLRPLVEVASAADSELYRSSSEATAANIAAATQEMPRFIAKNVKHFVDRLNSGDPALAGGVNWFWWRYTDYDPSDDSFPEDMSHAALTLGSVLLVWENRGVLDGLLARHGYAERVAVPTVLNAARFRWIANTFLRRIWYYDYTPGSQARNLLTDRVDGPYAGVDEDNDAEIPSLGRDADNEPLNGNRSATGFVGLAQFDPWVWIRARDSIFNVALLAHPDCATIETHWPGGRQCTWPALYVDNHAAIQRYRGFTGLDPTDDLVWGGPGWAIWRTVNGGYLGGTSATVSSDWSIAGAGDFNGDGSSDILWRNNDGRLQVYLMRDAQYLSTVSLGFLDRFFIIKGTGDVNGDNVSDLIFHHAISRETLTWLMGPRANVIARGNLGVSPAGWAISGMGDFNHDGKSDLFWTKRNAQTATETAIWLLSGATVSGYMSLSTPTVPSSYTFKGIGRVTGQYKDDIVWRNSDGTFLTWRSTSTTGSVVNISPVTTGWTGNEWDLKSVADITGDGMSDFVLFRSSDRRVEGWLLNSTGGFAQSTLLGYTDPGWSIKAAATFD